MGFEQDAPVVRLRDIHIEQAQRVLGCFSVRLELVADGCTIPGSYWGECEAGLIAACVYVRKDTPVHSMLHEACHVIVLPEQQRTSIHTNASDSIAEEDASCYLQLRLAEYIDGFGYSRACQDMDTWGYSFRLGSTHAWFQNDAEDASVFLQQSGIMDANHTIPALLRLAHIVPTIELNS
jgi:hypothetical protein